MAVIPSYQRPTAAQKHRENHKENAVGTIPSPSPTAPSSAQNASPRFKTLPSSPGKRSKLAARPAAQTLHMSKLSTRKSAVDVPGRDTSKVFQMPSSPDRRPCHGLDAASETQARIIRLPPDDEKDVDLHVALGSEDCTSDCIKATRDGLSRFQLHYVHEGLDDLSKLERKIKTLSSIKDAAFEADEASEIFQRVSKRYNALIAARPQRLQYPKCTQDIESLINCQSNRVIETITQQVTQKLQDERTNGSWRPIDAYAQQRLHDKMSRQVSKLQDELEKRSENAAAIAEFNMQNECRALDTINRLQDLNRTKDDRIMSLEMENARLTRSNFALSEEVDETRKDMECIGQERDLIAEEVRNIEDSCLKMLHNDMRDKSPEYVEEVISRIASFYRKSDNEQ